MANYTIVVYCTSAVAAYHGEHTPRHSLRRSHCSKSMPLARLSISNRVVATLPLAASGQQIVRDSDLAGSFALSGTRSKTYMIQSDLWENGRRRTVRIKNGEADGGFGSRAREARVELVGQFHQDRRSQWDGPASVVTLSRGKRHEAGDAHLLRSLGGTGPADVSERCGGGARFLTPAVSGFPPRPGRGGATPWPRAASIFGLPNLTPFALAAASADFVRPAIKAGSFSANAAWRGKANGSTFGPIPRRQCGLARPAAQSRFDRGRSLSRDVKCPTHQAKK
jgi:hypothetical protein